MADNKRSTVRGVPPEVRRTAADSADRGKMPVGAWQCAAFDMALRAEREPVPRSVGVSQADPNAKVVLMPRVADVVADVVADGAATLAERAVAAAVALAKAPAVPAGFRRRANRLLRQGLPVVERRVAGESVLLIDGSEVAALGGIR